jgi:hypothetical protein
MRRHAVQDIIYTHCGETGLDKRKIMIWVGLTKISKHEFMLVAAIREERN